MSRRRALVAALPALVLAAGAQAQGGPYPDRPIKLVVPFSSGGSTDLAARVIAEYAGRELRQPVIVDNRAGAGGSLGMEIVARSAPDGYTLGMATMSTHGSNPAAYGSKLKYDALRDFVPITNVASVPTVFMINPGVPAKSMQELIALAKAKPGKYSFATPGTGSLGHANMEYFQNLAGIQLLHIPYKGAGAALTDVLSGQVDIISDNLPSALPQIRSGKLRPLALNGEKRSPQLPDVPTFGELGFKEISAGSWFGIVAPAGTSPAIVARLNQAIHKAMLQPEFLKKMDEAGATPTPTTPEQFGEQIRLAIGRYAHVAKIARIAVD
ncbi:ABC transporter substrate-binding protein [Xylophilus rhododendri]|uniref:ABC transporter substrate-binding protein n=1 Tax=Xylophilus rhododendri TaxID=2697032 RepID=A0A857JF59_9BURK|nr:tripartite tricarboxylate transporter substrate binding protein BugE [Xylophilus rhododendri]QHJ01439.1 ABC transporter substrate-binding protein [Xylophilus rhododendri]